MTKPRAGQKKVSRLLLATLVLKFSFLVLMTIILGLGPFENIGTLRILIIVAFGSECLSGFTYLFRSKKPQESNQNSFHQREEV